MALSRQKSYQASPGAFQSPGERGNHWMFNQIRKGRSAILLAVGGGLVAALTLGGWTSGAARAADASQSAPSAAVTAKGQQVSLNRCAQCHDTGAEGAPPKSQLAS